MVRLGAVALACLGAEGYKIGTGIWDATGPAVQVTFIGYAETSQVGDGIHLRQRARAFVVSEDDDSKRVAFVSLDTGLGSDLVNQKVLERLEKTLGPGLYSYENLCVSATHTHSSPGGTTQYVLSEVTSYGYVKQAFEALVDGVAGAIEQAHRSLQPGRLVASEGLLFGANINRSPSSYERNPQEERDLYKDEGDTDKKMLQLRFEADKKQLGSINWFQVHGTSMNKTNTLVSGDNRGYASYLMERAMNGPDVDAGKGEYVAAFAATNLGDVSPNTAGPKCLDTGLPCDRVTSTCNGRSEMCAAFGPGTNGDMFESTEIIGRKQFEHAQKLAKDGVEVSGPVDYRHAFIDMFGRKVVLEDGSEASTCSSAALGYGFAAGTTDGCGMFDFTQGQNSTNPFWNIVSTALAPPSKEDRDCHAPKPILLNLDSKGIGSVPYDWEPRTVPVQILRIGQLFVVSVPSEFTTMSGRRVRRAIKEIVEKSGVVPEGTEVLVTIAGLGNSWNHYTTTFEEYQAQRYEAASTIYGPHTLSAYLQEFRRIATDMVTGKASDSDPAPEDLSSKLVELNPGVIFDAHPLLHGYGAVREDAKDSYQLGERVDVTFQSANPRNNLRSQDTFLTVERQEGDDWRRVATDGDWDTQFRWRNTGVPRLSAESTATVSWDISSETQPGTYRVCHFGDYREVTGQVKAFSGCSSAFKVVEATLV